MCVCARACARACVRACACARWRARARARAHDWLCVLRWGVLERWGDMLRCRVDEGSIVSMYVREREGGREGGEGVGRLERGVLYIEEKNSFPAINREEKNLPCYVSKRSSCSAIYRREAPSLLSIKPKSFFPPPRRSHEREGERERERERERTRASLFNPARATCFSHSRTRARDTRARRRCSRARAKVVPCCYQIGRAHV